MTEILGIVRELIIVAVSGVVAFAALKLRAYIKAKLGESQAADLYDAIDRFVCAAEQQFKGADKTGEVRFKYVAGLVNELGYAITDEITAYIEAAVFDLNKTERG